MNGSGLWTILRSHKNTFPIMALFVRDGAICFGMVFGVFIQNCGLLFVCALGTDSSSMSVLCSRSSAEYHFHNCCGWLSVESDGHSVCIKYPSRLGALDKGVICEE